MFSNNRATGNSGWHHPLEQHYTALATRLRKILVSKAQAAPAQQPIWQARYDFVLADHYAGLKETLKHETREQREIRRLRYAKIFRKHANKRLDEQLASKALLGKKVLDMLGERRCSLALWAFPCCNLSCPDREDPEYSRKYLYPLGGRQKSAAALAAEAERREEQGWEGEPEPEPEPEMKVKLRWGKGMMRLKKDAVSKPVAGQPTLLSAAP